MRKWRVSVNWETTVEAESDIEALLIAETEYSIPLLADVEEVKNDSTADRSE